MQASTLLSLVATLLIIGLVEDCSTSGTVNSLKALVSKKDNASYEFENIDQFRSFVEEVQKKDSSWVHSKDIEAILALGEIVTTQEVCSPSKIDELIDYHKKYLSQNTFFRRKKPITISFFTDYAIQVAYTCKKNLIHNLETAIEELKDRSKVFEEAKERVFHEEPSIKSNIKLIEEQPDDPVSSNVKPRDGVELTFSEYREALTQLRQPEDVLTFDRDDCLNSRNREIKVSTDKLQTFFKPALMCHQLHRFYGGSVLSIAKLANFGYTAYDDDLDSKLSSSPIIKDWIIAVQVCEPMLYMYTKETNDEWSIVDTCAPKVPAIETITYDDNLETLTSAQLKEMVSRSESTRSHAQKLMKSALRKIAKENLLKQLNADVKKKSIFSKSLALLTSQYITSSVVPESLVTSRSMRKFSLRMKGDLASSVDQNYSQQELSEKDSYDLLMRVVTLDKECPRDQTEVEKSEETDSAVSFVDPLSLMASTLTVLLIMITFEWLFFIVMSLAARLCHRLYFNFDNILTFPPKFLSWADADFAKYNDMVEKLDEDDFFDYDELSPDEKEQRNLLEKVFGRPPPLLYKD